MLALDMLDVTIGLVFVFLLLSLICSAINEIIEAKLKLRASDLEKGIRTLLKDYTGTGLTKSLYDHPLINNLFIGSYNTSKIKINKKDPAKNYYATSSNLPSYIPARNFALALMDVLLPATSTTQSGTYGALSPHPDTLPTPATGGGLTPAINKNPLQALRGTVNQITNVTVKNALLPIIDAAGEDAIKVKEGIENWYNSSMDRVAGWYKRRVQKIVFIMGFVVAIAMNADTFAIFNNLANDRPLRNSIVAAAQNFKNPSNADTSDQNKVIKEKVNQLLELGLPIGWGWKNELNPGARFSNLNAIPKKEDIGLWFLKIIGWLVTGIAISLGAPFWFDVLNRVMVVRSTVKPTEKSPDEASQDRQKSPR